MATSTGTDDWAPEDLETVDRCPVCGSGDVAPFMDGLKDRLEPGSVRRWRLDACRSCGSAFVPERPTPATAGRLYANYYTHVDPLDGDGGAGLKRRLRNGYLNARYGYHLTPASRLGGPVVALLPGGRGMASDHVRELPAPPPGRGTLLDVGCGNGAFVARMGRLGWTAAGVEPDPRAAAIARDAGLDVTAGELDPDATGRGRFDVVTLSHVIEHVHDAGDLLRRCAEVLVPGGRIWVATPNLRAAGSAGFGGDWIQLDPPRHLVLFTRDSLRGLLEANGFTGVREPPVAPCAHDWTFRLSVGVSRGIPEDQPVDLSRGLRARAVGADLAGLARRDRAQNVVMTARRA